jgi:hypothetical protein
MADYTFQKEVARSLLSAGIEDIDLQLHPPVAALTAKAPLAAAKPPIPFPAGSAPVPTPIHPAPDPSAALPKADVVVVTWTVDEQNALADVLTPNVSRTQWYRYNRNFAAFDPLIRSGAPAKMAHRLGSYFITKIKSKTVICFKSELHLNQDGIRSTTNPGTSTLPVKDMFNQIIDEAKPDVFLTVGTAGGVFAEQDLGDVVVTRAAKFRLHDEFKNEPFNDKTYTCDWKIPTTHFADATSLMATFKDNIQEPPEFLPPTVSFTKPAGGFPKPSRPYIPDIWLDGQVVNHHKKMPKFHPILTTDYFEYGTSTNHLEKEGCAVEMGDAVLGLAIEERKAAGKFTPNWAVVRNCSDPQINGLLRDAPKKESLQVLWAVYYYSSFGYWTSIMSALATWGIIAGL